MEYRHAHVLAHFRPLYKGAKECRYSIFLAEKHKINNQCENEPPAKEP